jgi:hypothetical protein
MEPGPLKNEDKKGSSDSYPTAPPQKKKKKPANK